LEAADFHEPRCPIYSNVTGTATTDVSEIRKRLYQQLTSPVLWFNSIKNMAADGAATFIETGPGKVLQGLIKRTIKDVNILGVSSVEELENLEWN
jgi:[acyl-carrier-protein] S-malonyltransferase